MADRACIDCGTLLSDGSRCHECERAHMMEIAVFATRARWLDGLGTRRYPLHQSYLVPVGTIELDEQVTDWVLHWFPPDAAQPYEGDEDMTTFPVVERGDRLVLAGSFGEFAALRDGGAAWATVYVLDPTDEQDLLELTGAIALTLP
jgi:hypothetical protein